MKTIQRIFLTFSLFILIGGTDAFTQNNNYPEKYGNTFNLGIGIGGYSGYYGYWGRTLPVIHLNYEFDIARNLTLAPFVTFFTNRGDHYRETVMPIGLKGTFYLDQLFRANSNWDFYVAGSAGLSIVLVNWDRTYLGDRGYWKNPGYLFLDVHLGVEYHISSQLGLFLDLSNGVSTFGLAIH